ncbi:MULTISPECIES: hypothetical protein [unclassified Lysobacter]|uniref:hypothetical protein n=1 Tax=unclassified Lysobacter TaxID=2635362 RepID=UPI001BE693BC|nr:MULTISPECIES: hypothetical protein [unclassified Lysobacter]MBT2748654.1 hypothetical protein [Lysobacter sp. ISL-42]MBT2751589.1 hypothetical protein [Lysobacter sp. ISL-50]MBT2775783.1 hypothetical protein [Lysobacter sp. ISL-54]MBT2782252.1 hypothetical protein [Lysobacter sp. ISL-52]
MRKRISLVAFALLVGATPGAAAPTALGVLGGNTCRAIDVNDGGAAIGDCRTGGGDFVPVYWPAAGTGALVLSALLDNGACNVVGLAEDGAIGGNCDWGDTGEQAPVRWAAPSLPSMRPEILNARTGDDRAEARFVNAAGAVAGISTTPGGKDQPVVWKGGQRVATALPVPGLLPPLLSPATECSVVALSPAPTPVAVGLCELRRGGVAAVQWTPNALGGYSVNVLPGLASGADCTAVAINGAGQIAGTCEDETGDLVAVRWSAAQAVPAALRGLPREAAAGQQLSAVDINQAGIVAGYYIDSAGRSRSFVWAPSQDQTSEDALDLGTLGGAGVFARQIADDGRIVGSAENAQGAEVGFAWGPGTAIADLGTLGGRTNSPAAISRSGQWIVGTSTNEVGQRRAYRIGPERRGAVTASAQRGLARTAYRYRASVLLEPAPSSSCQDLAADCPARAHLCNDSNYYALMTAQCPRTCGRCPQYPPGGAASALFDGPPSCEDKVPSCNANASLCHNSAYYTLMTDRCAKTCNRCPQLAYGIR